MNIENKDENIVVIKTGWNNLLFIDFGKEGLGFQ
jgi:hypothetical protein